MVRRLSFEASVWRDLYSVATSYFYIYLFGYFFLACHSDFSRFLLLLYHLCLFLFSLP
jgi:hypothetical protein